MLGQIGNIFARFGAEVWKLLSKDQGNKILYKRAQGRAQYKLKQLKVNAKILERLFYILF